MSSFWSTSDGEDIRDKIDVDKDLETGGGFEPLPDKTRVIAIVTEAGVKDRDGKEFVYATLEIQKPVAFARRKLFNNWWVFPGSDSPYWAEGKEKTEKDKNKAKFTKLDVVTGGKLAAKDEMPDDFAIARAFTNKVVGVTVGLFTPKDGGEPRNYVIDFWPKGSKEVSEVKAAPKPSARRQTFDDDLDGDDVPF